MHLLKHPLAGPVVKLTHRGDEALVAVEGAQVVSWRHDGREMLWCATSRLAGKPLRGGVPVCWPWFGNHTDDSTKPAHGIARQRQWTVLEQGAGHVAMSLRDGDLEARVDVWLVEELRISLTTRNHGATSISISAALHTYLAVDNIADVRVRGLDGATFIDKLDNNARKRQSHDLSFDREVDRIYAISDAAWLVEGARRVKVSGDGTSRSLVVWNPWADKAARLGDMPDGAYQRMLCMETAWAGEDTRLIAPGGSAVLTTVLQADSTPP